MALTEAEELELLRLKEKSGGVATEPTSNSLPAKAASFVNEINPLRLIKNQDIESLLLTLGGIGQPAEVMGETVKKAVEPGLSQLIASGVESVPKPPITPDEIIKTLISPETLQLPLRPLYHGFEAKTTPITDKVAASVSGQLKPSEIITNLAATGMLEGAGAAVKELPAMAKILEAASTTRLPADVQMAGGAMNPTEVALQSTPEATAAIPGAIQATEQGATETLNLAQTFQKSFSQRFANYLKKNPMTDMNALPKINKETVAITPDDLAVNQSLGVTKAVTLDQEFAKAFKGNTALAEANMQVTDKVNKLLESGAREVEDFPALAEMGFKNSDKEKVMETLRQSSTASGKILNLYSQLGKSITPEENALLNSIDNAGVPSLLQAWNLAGKGVKLALDTLKTVLVQTPATLIRNTTSTFLEYPIKTVFDGVNGVLEMLGGKPAAQSFAPFIQRFGAIYRALSPTSRKAFQVFMDEMPQLNEQVHRMVDLNDQNKFLNALGSASRWVEFKTRDLILDAKTSGDVGRQAGITSQDLFNWGSIESKLKTLPIEDQVKATVNGAEEALNLTYGEPAKWQLTKGLQNIFRSKGPIGPLLGFLELYPGFVERALIKTFDYSPLGWTRFGMNDKYVKMLESGDERAIAEVVEKSIAGTAAFYTMYQAVKKYGGEKWYELTDPKTGKYFDIRPYPVLAPYAGIANKIVEGQKYVSEGMTPEDAVSKVWHNSNPLEITEIIAGVTRSSGGNIFLASKMEGSEKAMQSMIAQILGGYTRPAAAVKDALSYFDKSQGLVLDTKQMPILGNTVSNIPGLSTNAGVMTKENLAETPGGSLFPEAATGRGLPAKFSVLYGGEHYTDTPWLKQVIGMRVYTKTPIEKTLDGLGIRRSQFDFKTGDAGLDNLGNYLWGKAIAHRLNPLVQTTVYQNSTEEQKKQYLQDIFGGKEFGPYSDISFLKESLKFGLDSLKLVKGINSGEVKMDDPKILSNKVVKTLLDQGKSLQSIEETIQNLMGIEALLNEGVSNGQQPVRP